MDTLEGMDISKQLTETYKALGQLADSIAGRDDVGQGTMEMVRAAILDDNSILGLLQNESLRKDLMQRIDQNLRLLNLTRQADQGLLKQLQLLQFQCASLLPLIGHMDSDRLDINRDAMKMLSDEFIKLLPSVNEDAVKDIMELPHSTIFLILYESTLIMRKHNTGMLIFDEVSRMLDSAVDSFAEVKVIRSIFDYLRAQLNQAEGFDKVPYLESLGKLVSWLQDNVNFSTKQ